MGMFDPGQLVDVIAFTGWIILCASRHAKEALWKKDLEMGRRDDGYNIALVDGCP
jgi:hypothetical protein